jgi:signal transduction histidine kinase
MRLTALYAGLFATATTGVLVTVNLLLQRMVDRRLGASALVPSPLPSTSIPSTPPCAVFPSGPPPLALPTHPPGGATGSPGDVHMGSSVNPAKDLGARMLAYQWNVTWIAVGVLAVVGAAAGWWLAGRVLRPVHRITATARRLSLDNLHERIGLTGPRDELRMLADTFDAMLERLEHAADNQRRFAANASHELRTPLTIQRTAIELGFNDPSPEKLARTRARLLDANLRTERLIDGLLALAQGERGADSDEPVRLDRITREAADQHQAMADEATVTLHTDLHPAPGVGDPVLLGRLVANLLHNAVRHNHPGGHVRVRTDAASVTVSNTGPLVPTERVPSCSSRSAAWPPRAPAPPTAPDWDCRSPPPSPTPTTPP